MGLSTGFLRHSLAVYESQGQKISIVFCIALDFLVFEGNRLPDARSNDPWQIAWRVNNRMIVRYIVHTSCE